MGISRISCIYSNIVFDGIEWYVDSMIKSRGEYSIDLIIGPRLIQDSIIGYEDDFLDYPVQRMRITLSIKTGKVSKKIKQGFTTTGAMWGFDYQKNGFSYVTKRYDVNFNKKILDEISVIGDIKLDIGIILDSSRFRIKEISKLKMELMSLIMHELNHGYEYWLRYQNNLDIKSELSFMEIDRYHFTKKVYNKLNIFLFYIYWSLPHEQNAKVQEFYPYVLDHTFDELRELYPYKCLIDMINFNGERYYDELISLIPKKDVDKVTKKALNSFISTYKDVYDDSFDLMDKKIIMKKDIKDIFNHYENIIKTSGENMRRKVLKLYSLKNELNE
jgi:hypothetical protein